MQACPTGGFDLLMGGKDSLSSLRVRLVKLGTDSSISEANSKEDKASICSRDEVVS